MLARWIEEGHSAPPFNDCDVCAFLPESCRLQLVPQEVEKALAAESEDLAEQRAKRTKLLYELYMGQADGADALLWARMADALDGVRELPQRLVK